MLLDFNSQRLQPAYLVLRDSGVHSTAASEHHLSKEAVLTSWSTAHKWMVSLMSLKWYRLHVGQSLTELSASGNYLAHTPQLIFWCLLCSSIACLVLNGTIPGSSIFITLLFLHFRNFILLISWRGFDSGCHKRLDKKRGGGLSL